jgi:regulator of replication initiation timing
MDDHLGALLKQLQIVSNSFEALAAECGRLTQENERLRAALLGVEPYIDAIVCYASTMDEHEPNRIAVNVRAALSSHKGGG